MLPAQGTLWSEMCPLDHSGAMLMAFCINYTET